MKRILLILFISFPLFLFSQNETDFIKWNADRKLVWNDFEAVPMKNTDAAALTATHLGFSYNVINNKTYFTIECKFDKKKSWGLSKTQWILDHEQGHFDIAEIFTRKLFKSVAAYQFNKISFQSDLDSLYKKIIREKELFQQLYDADTDHSRNKLKQEEWLKKIATDMNDLKSWANY